MEQDIATVAARLGVDTATARQIMANKQLQETKIMQKVNGVTREAFHDRFPGQLEHCLRLIMERLQAGLDKRGGVDPSRPDTWILSATDIQSLAGAAHCMHTMIAYIDETKAGIRKE
jgi:hypothetical protein